MPHPSGWKLDHPSKRRNGGWRTGRSWRSRGWVDDAAARALSGPRHPIGILPRREGAALPDGIAPGNPTLGVMLPYTPLHHLLFRGAEKAGTGQEACPTALVMTSGNLSEEPIVVENHDARQRLGGVADWFLVHNRDIYMRADDSV